MSTGEGKNKIYYSVEEYYRVRYTSERMYLLDYERTMTQIPDTGRMYANDKILLGITDENVDMVESTDGNTVVFSDRGQLLCYNAVTNGLTVIFSFYDKDNADCRTLYDHHGIKILDVDEGGNVKFAVYGYMNRGRHEGETGIQILSYDNSLNTIEEEVYIPYSKSYAVLKDEMGQLLYRNRQQHLYFFLENGVYDVDLENRSAEQLVSIRQDDSLQVSENHEIIVWQEGDDINHSNQLNVRNLNTGEQTVIRAEDGDAIRPLGFMGEDIIYGVARESDIRTENSGQIFYPMYKVCISNSSGASLKEYGQEGIYVVGCTIESNQITLSRLQRTENGSYQEILDDQIMNNVEEEAGQNKVVTANIDIYERYVQIQTKSSIDAKTIKVLNPKEVVFEGGRELELDAVSEVPRYYVCNAYGVCGIYSAPGTAVKEAYDTSGIVTNDRGVTVWLKGNRVSRNQIMAIKEESVTEQKNSLAVCLDNILRHAGITRNTEYDLAQGKTATTILSENMTGVQVLDLSGCTLDAVLYYVNQDIPVLDSPAAGMSLTSRSSLKAPGMWTTAPSAIAVWLHSWSIGRPPKHREHIRQLLEQYGCDDLEGFLQVTRALSLNDTFWVKRQGEVLQWRDVSLYTNPFSEVISEAAFDGTVSETDFPLPPLSSGQTVTTPSAGSGRRAG